MSKKHLLLMEMASVVPKSAQGYVSDLENGSENVVEDRLQMLERHCPDLVARFRKLPAIGGKRDRAGRPAPHGRKVAIGIRVTPDVVEFCKQHPQGFVVLEEKLRKSKEFREWLAGRQPRSE